jgi:hypothetical protein
MASIKDYAKGMVSTDRSPYYKNSDLSKVRPSMFHENSSYHCILTGEYKPPYWGFRTHWKTGFAISAMPFVRWLKTTGEVGMSEFSVIGDAIVWCCKDLWISEEDCLKCTENIIWQIRNRVKELASKELPKSTNMNLIDGLLVNTDTWIFSYLQRNQDAYK